MFFIPIILIGAALIGGGVGVKKGYDGVSDMNEAKRIGKNAESRYNSEIEEVESFRKKVNSHAERFGNNKLKVLQTTVKSFVDYTKRIGGRIAGKDYTTLDSIRYTPEQIKQLENMISASFSVGSGASSIAAGVALKGGITALVGHVGVASTGAAISGLSGAAATNATLAWFGGGALSAGGFGMAGGAVVLGAVAVGPALLLGGFLLASKGEKALTKAYEYEAEVDKAIGKMSLACSVMRGIDNRMFELNDLLCNLNKRIQYALEKLETWEISDSNIENPDFINDFQKTGILVKAIADIIEVPVLDENEDLTAVSANLIVKTKTLLNSGNL